MKKMCIMMYNVGEKIHVGKKYMYNVGEKIHVGKKYMYNVGEKIQLTYTEKYDNI